MARDLSATQFKELVMLIIQFFNEEKFEDALHSLERESGVFFNMKYLEDSVMKGDWDNVEKYLLGFTKFDDNRHSIKIFFIIRKQKYLEALDKNDYSRAHVILREDLKVFSTSDKDLYKQLKDLLFLGNFRENEMLSGYGDEKTSRKRLVVDLRKLIEVNPMFEKKLQFPATDDSRLRILVNRSLEWQHQVCESPKPDQAVKSFLVDHTSGSMPRVGGFLPLTSYDSQSLASTEGSPDDLPKTLIANLNQGSAVKTMDFHPWHQSLLLVGTNTGDIVLWEVSTRERLVVRNINAWELGKHSMNLQATLANSYPTSVNKVLWSPNGAFLGVAYSKKIVQVYSYHGGKDLRNHLEIDAHDGSVTDITFATLKGNLCIVTSGEDKIIKLWDLAKGTMRQIFEGHEAPVISLCPHEKHGIKYFFSTGFDGKIKAWLYDKYHPHVNCVAPGHSCIRLAYNTDGNRLFSFGTTKEGEPVFLEWNDNDRAVIRAYHGLGKRSAEVVQFDTSKRFLAVGDESAIKYWDMDSVNVLTITDAEGGLPAFPTVRFSKDGMLLAVATNDNGVKVLANTDGIKLVRSIQPRAFEAPSGINFVSAAKHGDGRVESNIWKLAELEEPSQLRSLKLPDNLSNIEGIHRLVYTNSGRAVLALTSTGVHKLWRWPTSNTINVASVDVSPQLWQPASGEIMTNVVDQINPEAAVHCFALSKNDSCVISSSGGEVSLFQMSTFKTRTTFMNPPPAATSLAFLPEDNNIIAVGTNDSSIQIYNVRLSEIMYNLRGHEKIVTGLVFSSDSKVLISSGADAQVCVWSVEGWEKQTSQFLHIPSGRNPAPLAPTHVQFHQDQFHLLVVHESQLAIYEAPELNLIKKWVPQDTASSITDAMYSCDRQLIYAIINDGSVGVFIANTLRQSCRISPTAYIPQNLRYRVRPLVIATHTKEPKQFAVGLSDGGVYILEPLQGEGNWGPVPPDKSGVGPSLRSV